MFRLTLYLQLKSLFKSLFPISDKGPWVWSINSLHQYRLTCWVFLADFFYFIFLILFLPSLCFSFIYSLSPCPSLSSCGSFPFFLPFSLSLSFNKWVVSKARGLRKSQLALHSSVISFFHPDHYCWPNRWSKVTPLRIKRVIFIQNWQAKIMPVGTSCWICVFYSFSGCLDCRHIIVVQDTRWKQMWGIKPQDGLKSYWL